MYDLDTLADLYARRDLMATEKQEAMSEVMTLEIRMAVQNIENEYATKALEVTQAIAAAEEEIKAQVLAAGATVRGKYYMATWNKGRTTWDSAKLDGMAAIIPQLNEARKVGQPTVSFKAIGK